MDAHHSTQVFQDIVTGATTHYVVTEKKANIESEAFCYKPANQKLKKIIVQAYCQSKAEDDRLGVHFEAVFSKHLRHELIKSSPYPFPNPLQLWWEAATQREGIMAVCCTVVLIMGMVLFAYGFIGFMFFTISFLIGGVVGMLAMDILHKHVSQKRDKMEQLIANEVLASLL